MTKAELIDRIARSRDVPPDMTKKEIAALVDIAFDELADYFARARVTRTTNPRFTFPGFGTFTKKKRSARRGVNPRTLEPIQIEASHTLDFKPGSELRSAMNPERTPGKARSGTKASAKPKAGKSGRSGAAGGRRKAGKKRTKKPRKAAKKATRRGAPSTVAGRRMTPRDEDAELDALIDDDVLYEEIAADLPTAGMQRARAEGATTRRRRTG